MPSDSPLVRPLVGGVLALAVAVGIGRFAYTPILPAMARAASLDPRGAGLLASANYLGYLAGALAIAAWTLGAQRDRVLGGCLLGVALTTGAMAATTDVVAWGFIRFVTGLASAGAFVLVSAAALDLLRRRGASALAGWLYGGVGAGIAISGAVVRVVDTALGWRGDWLVLAALGAVLVAFSLRWLPVSSKRPATRLTGDSVADRGIGVVLALLVVSYFFEGTGYSATGTFLVVIVDAMPGLHGIGPSAWIIVGLAAAPSCVLWSRLAARVGFAPALVVAYLAQAVGTLAPVLAQGPTGAVLAALLFGGTFMGIVSLTLTLGGQLAPARSAGVIGVLTAAFGLGQIVGPTLAGVLASGAGGFGPALTAAAAVVLLGGVLTGAIWRLESGGARTALR